MATTYSGLKTEIAAFINRTDLTSMLDTFIDLCESEMQVECKLMEFETTATLTFTSGAATLPTGWLHARSVVWSSDTPRVLQYVTPARLAAINAARPAFVSYYTVVGTEMKVADDGDGSADVIYNAKFTPLSDSNTSNGILSEYPGAYLYGSLKHAAAYQKDRDAAMGYDALFKEAIGLIQKNNAQRKYAGATLQVRNG